MDAQSVTAALDGKWYAERREGSAKCPAHEDRHPSLSISDGQDGKLLAHCHTGCTFVAIRDALKARGIWHEDDYPVLAARSLVPTNGNGHGAVIDTTSARQIVAEYSYYDENGALLYQAVRYAPKDFRQRQLDEHGKWVWSLSSPPVRLVLYRLPELLAATPTRTVFVVEGEKDVERLRDLGFVATTNPMGAKKWRAEFSETLRGRPVVIIPDNDTTGEEHAAQVVAALLLVVASVKVVRLPDLPDKGDVSDWLDAGGTRAVLEQLVRQTASLTSVERPAYPVQRLGALLRLVESNPPQIIDRVIWAERVHWAFAAPGAGKTLFLLAAGLHIAAGKPFCKLAVRQMPVLLIEEDSPFSVLAEYAEMLAAIYGFNLDELPFWINQEQGLRLSDDEGPAKLYSAIDACPERPGFVLLDACERLIPSDKFSSKEFDPMTRLLQRMVTDHITPAVIDHTRRPSKNEQPGPVDFMELLYGGRSKSAISDVMMHFSGSPRSPMRITFAKFRGEPPPPIDMTFAADTGFVIKPPPRIGKTKAEKAVLAWFDGVGAAWQDLAVIAAGTQLSDKALRDTLGKFVTWQWLEREGAKKQGTRYRNNPDGPGVFT